MMRAFPPPRLSPATADLYVIARDSRSTSMIGVRLAPVRPYPKPAAAGPQRRIVNRDERFEVLRGFMAHDQLLMPVRFHVFEDVHKSPCARRIGVANWRTLILYGRAESGTTESPTVAQPSPVTASPQCV